MKAGLGGPLEVPQGPGSWAERPGRVELCPSTPAAHRATPHPPALPLCVCVSECVCESVSVCVCEGALKFSFGEKSF